MISNYILNKYIILFVNEEKIIINKMENSQLNTLFKKTINNEHPNNQPGNSLEKEPPTPQNNSDYIPILKNDLFIRYYNIINNSY
jgi:hypothetical protein